MDHLLIHCELTMSLVWDILIGLAPLSNAKYCERVYVQLEEREEEEETKELSLTLWYNNISSSVPQSGVWGR